MTLLEVAKGPIGGAFDKPKIMNETKLSLFVPYELFPYLELIYHMVQCMDKKGY